MSHHEVKQYNELYQKCGKHLKKSINSAIGSLEHRSNKELRIDHVLLNLFENTGSDFYCMVEEFGERPADIQQYFNNAMLEFEKVTRKSSFHSSFRALLKETWVNTQLQFQDTVIRSGYLIYTLLQSEHISSISPETC